MVEEDRGWNGWIGKQLDAVGNARRNALSSIVIYTYIYVCVYLRILRCLNIVIAKFEDNRIHGVTQVTV